MKRIFLTAVVAMFAFAANAQVTFDYLKAADDYYKKGNYISAAEYYEKYLGKKGGFRQDAYDPYTVQSLSKEQRTAVSNKQQAIYNLAESYRLLNYYVKAEPYQQQATSFDKTKYPLSKYKYGKTLRALEKFSEADSAFTSFLADYTTEDDYSKDAKRELANLKFRETQLAKSDLKLYTVNKAGDGLNSDGGSYAPVWMNNNTLLFTSTRGDSAAAKNKVHTNRVYQASYNNGVMGDISKVGIAEPANMHQGVVSITPNGNTIFVTRWMMTPDGKKTAAIYSSNKTSGAWSEPTKLDSVINATGYNAQEPFVMPDGKNMIFSSNREGGLGGFDLWSAPLDANGNAGTPVNLGATINTANDERGPYYHALSNSLVFSSNGRVGMGGFDFYQSKGSLGSWGAVENLGYPLNSSKDDIYFVSKGKAF
jgi:OmpA-OmpF porin, OOP family